MVLLQNELAIKFIPCEGDGSACTSGCTNPEASNYNPDATIDDGNCTLSIQEELIPETFMLSSFPNPFNPVVTVSFAISKIGLTSIGVFDIRGRKLATLTAKNYQPGYYTVNWNASIYASGVYFITLVSSDTKLTQKILLLK